MAGRALATAFVTLLPDGIGFREATKKELEGVTAPAGTAGAKAGEAFAGNLLGKVQKVARDITIGLAGVAAGVAVEGVRMAAKFNSEMEMLVTQAGVAQKQVGSLSAGVLKLAGQVGFSPDSLAESLYHVESNFHSLGITGPRALQLVKIAAEGAATGHADLVDVTNALTAMVASGIPGVRGLDQAMGVLNATVGAGDMKMQDLAEAFGSGVVATVKGFGLTIQDVGAALATFGDNNIRGSHAGTQLRMSVMALAAPTKAGAKLLGSMGIQANQLADDMQKGGLKLALTDLVKHLREAGVTAKTQGDVITTAFGKKAGAGLNILADEMDRFLSKYPALNKGATQFGAAWKHTQQTVQQQFHEVGASFDALAIKIGDKLLPVVMKVFEWMRGHTGTVIAVGSAIAALAVSITVVSTAWKTYVAVTGIATAVTKAVAAQCIILRIQLAAAVSWYYIQAAASKAAAVAQAIWTTAMLYGTAAITAVRDGTVAMRIALAAVAVQQYVVAAASKVAAAAQWLWNLALDANPIGVVVVAIAALVGGIIYAYTHFKVFREVVADVWGWIKDHWKLIFLLLTGPVGFAVLVIIKHWKEVRAGAEELWHYVWTDFGAKIFGFFVHTLPGWLRTAWGLYVTYYIDPVKHGLTDLFTWVWTDFGAKIMHFFLSTFPSWLQQAVSFADRYFIQPVEHLLSDLYQWVWTDFGAKINNFLIVTIPGWFKSAVRFIGDNWTAIENVLKVPVNWVIQYIYDDGIRKIWNFIANIAGVQDLPLIPTLARGGLITGGTGPTSDDVLARVSKGEAVVDAARTRILAPLFAAMGLPGFAKGGVVGNVGMTGTSQASHAQSLLGGIGDTFRIMAALATGNKVALAHAIEDLFPAAGGSGAKTGSGLLSLITNLPVVIVNDLVAKAIAAFGQGSNAIVSYAESFIGKVPYVWGGSTPAGWDCSGFTSWVYDHFGYTPPRTAAAQQAWAQPTGAPVRGGLAFFAGADGTAAQAGHVGIIVGTNQMVDAFGTGFGTRLNSIYGSSGAVGGFGIPPGGFGNHPGLRITPHDNGGFLPPGLSVNWNGTGRPERVTTAAQETAMTDHLGDIYDVLDEIADLLAGGPGRTGQAVADSLNGASRQAGYRAYYSPR